MMAEQNKIELAELEIAKASPLGIIKESEDSRFPYPAFTELVRHQLHQDYNEKDLRSDGLQIFTTLDPVIQKLGEQVMIKGLKKLEKEYQKARKLQGAMVVTGSENGEVLALINGRKPQYAGFNRPLNAVRQIGSLAKVAVYLTALEKSDTYSLTSTLNDAPYEWVDYNTGEIWKPKNYDNTLHGHTFIQSLGLFL
jgi:penicillin-binding protein 1B